MAQHGESVWADVSDELICCYLCHRYRKPETMDGRRCADREACLKAAFRAKPVTVPKRVLRKQFGGDRIE